MGAPWTGAEYASAGGVPPAAREGFMQRDEPKPNDVREGLLREDPVAVRAVRSWIAALVYGADWRLEDPEAAIQETVVRVIHLARTGRVRYDTDFKAFVRTVTRHECTDLYRRERSRGDVEAAGAAGSRSPSDPQEALERKERLELLKFIVQALPAECVRLWSWIYREDMSAAQVAERLGITAVNARVRLHRCVEKAREISGRYFAGAMMPAGEDDHGAS